MLSQGMKSKFFVIFIMLISFLAISSVHAADNATADDINVTFDSQVYEKDLGYIEVEIPENTSGNLKATINDVEFYNRNVSSDVRIPITIPEKAKPLIVPNRITDHRTYSIYLFFNNIAINSSHTLTVMSYPPDYEIPAFFEEILKNDDSFYPMIMLPESVNGTLDIFIDGEFKQSLKARQYLLLNSSFFTSLALGNHTFRAVFSGDDYYRRFDKSFNFTAVDMTIHIPAKIVLDHDDCISAKIMDNRDGVVTVYVDGRAVFKDSLDRGEFLHSMFGDITCGKHLIEVQYNASKFSKSKKVFVNVEYYLDSTGSEKYRYGEDVEVSLIFPSDARKQFISIALDGAEIRDFTVDESGWVDLNLHKLKAGNHSLTFSYAGDKKYDNKSEEFNFTVVYAFDMPYFAFMDENPYVSLTLPEDASGNLEVYINNTLYATSKLKDGDAFISLKNLIPGKYYLLARYTAGDYNLTDAEQIFEISPDIVCPYEIICGEDKFVTLIGSKNINANATFMIGSQNYTVQFRDGKARFSLKNLKVGQYDIEATYLDENGFSCMLYSYIDVLKPILRITGHTFTYTQNAKIKVYSANKPVKNSYVTFKINKKTLKVKTDKNGVAVLKTSKLKPGKYTISASYLGSKTTKKLTVKHILTLNKVKVKKSSKKVTLKAKLSKKLKNKVIRFKFNGKTKKAKTDRYGVAKVSFTNLKLKAGRTVVYSAAYLSDSVKKSVKVGK